MMKIIDDLRNYLLDWLYPKDLTCLLCHETTASELCDTCLSQVQFNIGKCCIVCGRMIHHTAYDVCEHCKSYHRHFERGVSVVVYDDYIKEVLKRLKYHHQSYLAENIAKLMFRCILQKDIETCYDVIVPVPLHTNREQTRGFNQAALIAKHLSKLTGLPVVNGLKRVLDTQPLNQMTKEERLNALESAFDINDQVTGHVILVDDIFTTGTTVNQCAKALKDNGVSNIMVATFAVGEL